MTEKILDHVEALILRRKNTPLDWWNKNMWRQLDARICGLAPTQVFKPGEKFRIRPKEKT